MIHDKRVVVVMPAYNAAATLAKTFHEIPFDVVDDVVLVDDASRDETVKRARRLGIEHIIQHPRNCGYGANQKSCYRRALALGADIVVMLHPDYQYTPRLITAMATMIASGLYDIVLASRILGGGAVRGGMPRYKYVANRCLTFFQNTLLGQKLSEYHTGYRAFSRKVLAGLPLEENADGFVFDNEMLAQAIHFEHRIGEITCPTRYAPESSSINLGASLRYGLCVLRTTFNVRFQRLGLRRYPFLDASGRRLFDTDENSESTKAPEGRTSSSPEEKAVR